MFATSFLALAAVASFVVAAPVEQRGPPANWAYGYLEDYDTYHVRYLALKCYDQKNTAFFQDCCRPMLSTETLDRNRKAICRPSAEDTAYVSSSLAGDISSASATASADVAAVSEYAVIQSSASVAATSNARVAAAATSSVAASSSAAAVQYIAPAASSTTSTTPAYTPPATSTTPAYTPPAATTTQASSNNGETMSGGFATYFFQGGNAGACGTVHGDGDKIIAIDQARWGSSSFGGGSSTCGKWITVTNTNNGKSVTAMVADVCPTCVNGNSLDLSQGAFQAIASESDGMVPISWHWA